MIKYQCNECKKEIPYSVYVANNRFVIGNGMVVEIENKSILDWHCCLPCATKIMNKAAIEYNANLIEKEKQENESNTKESLSSSNRT
jgi:adenylosuccinate synthase